MFIIRFFLLFKATWRARETKLNDKNISFVTSNDLIDRIWPTSERASKPNSQIEIHGNEYSGKKMFIYMNSEYSIKVYLFDF
jgi:hypothetical protein